MPYLQKLSIQGVRNLLAVDIATHPSFNIFIGANGSGKTSFLEAIYLLALGKSFRSHLNRRIIHYDQDKLTLFGIIANAQHGEQLAVGLEKNSKGESKVKVAGELQNSHLLLAQQLPIQIINNESFELLTAGPGLRRQFLNWGMFHVKHSFMSVWRHYTESLRQRNSALRQHANTKEITAWDQGLVHYGTQLDAMYAEYCLELIPYVETMVGEMLDLTFQFAYQGCNQAEMDYAVALQNALDRDLSLGYTTFGPHRADLQIRLNGMPAQDVLSRGQQKLLVSAMRLAQGQLLSEKLSKQSIYLIDDLAAELDDQHCTRLIQQLLNLKAQVFMTGIQLSTFASLQQEASSVMFHVKHGEVSQVTR